MLKQTDARFRTEGQTATSTKPLAEIRAIAPRAGRSGVSVPKFIEIGAPPNWNRFAISCVLHLIAIVLLIRVTQLIVRREVHISRSHYESITLIAPTLERPAVPKPEVRAPKIVEHVRVPRQLPVNQPKVVEAPKPEAPKIKVPPVEPPKAMLATATPAIPKPPIPEKKVTVGEFSSGSYAKPTVKVPVKQVQTGGFGDPNGVAGKSDQPRKATVASVGAFDLPSAPGQGNGSGGRKGIPGTVANAGFGDGVASTGAGDRNPAGHVSVGGFGDAAPTRAATRTAVESPVITPVKILYKPRPVYTAEAKKMSIEGEVLLDVMFSASGDVRVLRVVRGLGHGLDEAAQRAAQQIRFQPAKRDGHPYDSNAVVHIVFEMAE